MAVATKENKEGTQPEWLVNTVHICTHVHSSNPPLAGCLPSYQAVPQDALSAT